MEQLDANLWVFRYDLSLGVIPIGRTVTVIRLQTGALVVHSTAPFTAEDIAAIRALGEPRWLTDVTNFHDTFAEEGRRCFPGVTYLVPEGFPAKASAGATEPGFSKGRGALRAGANNLRACPPVPGFSKSTRSLPE